MMSKTTVPTSTPAVAVLPYLAAYRENLADSVADTYANLEGALEYLRADTDDARQAGADICSCLWLLGCAMVEDEWDALQAARPDVCDYCSGSGIFYGAGVVENGVFKGYTGPCYRCGGKGTQTEEDRRRNWGYDRYGRRITP